ncbi:MAG: VCBS repeat-containing protein, partial [Candidatus Marinimicrobia bacterium]|nr:VCBS repeat-containing protein [Candidatus Neomarinimicrobiota bacterium]
MPSPDQPIRILGGGWDHRTNNQLEFLAIREAEDSLAPSVVVYYEETGAETLAVLWSYSLDEELPARLVDASVTDLNGDGLPEIALLIHYTNVPDKLAPPWLLIFDWDPASFIFSRVPTSSWNYTGRGISYLRPTQLITADLDNDGDQELVIAMGSPDKMVLIADWEAGEFQIIEELRPGKVMRGAWPFSTAVADFNGDGRKDLLVMGHGERPAVQAYLSGSTAFHEISVAATIGKRILPGAVAAGDINGDGQEEVILPHSDGSLTLVSMAGSRLAAAALDTRIVGLVDLAIAELDGDAIAEMIYLQADGTITTNDAQFVTPVTRERVLSRLPEGVQAPVSYDAMIVVAPTEERPGSIIFPIRTPNLSFIAFAELGQTLTGRALFTSMDTTMGDANLEVNSTPDAELFGIQVEGREVYLPGRLLSPDPRALPSNRTPDILLYVGDEFTQPVIGERIEQFARFIFQRKPPDMVFNFQRQAIVWQPTEAHLGAWNVEYEITYHTGVTYEDVVTDSAQEFRVIPESESERDQILIYVNDKPRITTQPETLNLLAGHLFAYRIGVNDRNSDAHLDYRLESGPDGMTLDKNAIITWRTNETHHDDYQVVISVSDGFDKDVQTFTLSVNALL